jgi:hypothetical protein
LFGLGWQDALGSDNYTDDDSAYVEIHGGLAPTFDDPYRLEGYESIGWSEDWYPVNGIGGLTYADSAGALHVERENGLSIGLYVVRPFTGKLIVSSGTDQFVQRSLHIDPATPFSARFLNATAAGNPLTVQLLDEQGDVVLSYTDHGP